MYMAKSIPISVTVDQDLLAEIDADVKRTRLSRSAWLALAAEGLLRGDVQRPFVRRAQQTVQSESTGPARRTTGSFDPDEVVPDA